MQKISDRVLRETNNTSDKRCFSNLVDLAMQEVRKSFYDETAIDKMESDPVWRERQLLLQHRAAALDARERALKPKESIIRKCSYQCGNT